MNRIYNTISHHTFSNENHEPPIACVAVHKDNGNIFFSSRNMPKSTMPEWKSKRKMEKWRGHAEYNVINLIKAKNLIPSEFNYFISFQPCNGCARLFKRNSINKAYFIVDKGFKSDEELKGNIELVKLEPVNSLQRRIVSKITPRIQEVIKERNF